MVKIRYAGSGVVLSSRALIEQAITNTSVKFGDNIVANRFEQTTSTTYEVTIKCASSSGKGAKCGASGRRTRSCCWHAWSTFFDELFRLNPAIVIIAQGRRITRESGNWIDHCIGNTLHESEMCNCEAEGWVREQAAYDVAADTVHSQWVSQQNAITTEIVRRGESPSQTPVERIMEVGRELHDMMHTTTPDTQPLSSIFTERATHPEPRRSCDASCRYNSVHHNGVLCRRDCCGGLTLWEAYAPTVERTCETCRHNRRNNRTGNGCTRLCHCPELTMWEAIVVGATTDTRECCIDCAYSRERRVTAACPRNRNEACLSDNRHRNFVRWVDDPTPMRQRQCCNCKWGAGHSSDQCNCSTVCLVGSDHRLFVEWVAGTPTVTRECANCKYSYSHNNDISCFRVVGECGSGNPKWELYVAPSTPPEPKTCKTCKYWHTDCYEIIGSCSTHSKWVSRNDLTELCVERYALQPQVMPEERDYMDLEGVM